MPTKKYGAQAGYLLIVVALMLFAVTGTIATKMLEATVAKGQRDGTDQQVVLLTIQNALASFATVNKRLPCPADGSLPPSDSQYGIELRAADGICTSLTSALADQKTGIVPWQTLGLKIDEVRTADLSYISYRVFSGPKGFTVDNGADMSNCDTDNGLTANAALSATSRCIDAAHNSTEAQFVGDKGLTVTNDTGDVTAAYVLIHHGANAAGAYVESGSRNPLPVNVASKEYSNTQGTDATTYTATFYATTPNTSVAASSVDYFDDRLAFSTISDVAKQSGLMARNWPEVGDILTEATLEDAGFDLSKRSQSFGSVTIGSATYTAASGGSRITIDSTGTTTAIGVGTSSGSRTISGTDSLDVSYPTPQQKISIILSQLGKKTSGASDNKFEAVTLQLRDSSDDLVATVSLTSCGTTTDVSTNVIAFDNVTAGVSFSKITIKPGISGDSSVATAANTNFYLKGLAPCGVSATTCIPVGATYSQSCSFTFTTP